MLLLKEKEVFYCLSLYNTGIEEICGSLEIRNHDKYIIKINVLLLSSDQPNFTVGNLFYFQAKRLSTLLDLKTGQVLCY